MVNVKNRTVKKIFACVAVFAVLNSSAQGAYKVEIDDDTYVSDEVYFTPVSTWDEVVAERINLAEGKVLFYAGEENQTYKINAEVMPLNTTNKKITYKSDDITIAEVDENGVITPTDKIGDTFIDIKCGNALAKLKVRVVKGVEGVAMSQSEMTLYADKPITAKLTAMVSPTDATIQKVSWYSEDESIAAVDSEGLVSPCGVGETAIYAKTEDGDYTAKCTVTVTTWEKRKEEIPVVYSDYDMTVNEMVELQMNVSPTVFTNGVFPAGEENVEQYVNPENLVSGYEKYQFMDLGASNNVDSAILDTYLKGKGVLDGRGSEFKQAADNNSISEVYLVIHACLETGNGSSELSNGIEYNGVTVYNLFGIGAVDEAPIEAGAEYAYKQGWTSVKKAIEGGAKWISENYINNSKYGQNTLYKMRWNPEKPAEHQYATDIAWASKQAKSMSSMFEAFPTAKYKFEIPRYDGQEELEIK